MTLTEAFVKTAAFYPNDDSRAQVICALVAGTSDLCDNCGFIKAKGTVCEVCENAWADEQAAKEEELSWGRLEMAGGRW